MREWPTEERRGRGTGWGPHAALASRMDLARVAEKRVFPEGVLQEGAEEKSSNHDLKRAEGLGEFHTWKKFSFFLWTSNWNALGKMSHQNLGRNGSP